MDLLQTIINGMQEFIVPTILITCFILGEFLKKIPQLNSNYIAPILGLIGVFIATWSEGFAFNPHILLLGLASGWASSGAWETYKNLFRDPQITIREDKQELRDRIEKEEEQK